MTLPLKGELTPKQPISPDFEFTGEVSILIEGGSGTVELQRSLKGSDFFPVTDTTGNPATYAANGSVVLNAELVNKSNSAKYRLEATTVDTSINYTICK